MNKIKLLIVDDSALVRQILRSGLEPFAHIDIVGAAADPYQARDMIVKFRPDIMTLDVEMPRMNGLEFLKKLMPQFPMPVVMVSSLTEAGSEVTMNALALGAFDFITKPASNLKTGLASMMNILVRKIDVAYENRDRIKAQISKKPIVRTEEITSLKKTTDKIIAIGASTGGTEALADIVAQFPQDFPGVVIVQHMPPVFTKSFAARLNRISKMEVKEAVNNDRILQGRILVAEGSKQLRVKRSGGHYIVEVGESDLISGHCPSVDVMFDSISKEVGANAIGVILTGMGKDGAIGLKEMREKGSVTISQDESSCVVYGMPKAAVDIGAVMHTTPLEQIPMLIRSSIETI